MAPVRSPQDIGGENSLLKIVLNKVTSNVQGGEKRPPQKLPSVFSRSCASRSAGRSSSLAVLQEGVPNDGDTFNDWEAGVSVIASILNEKSDAYRVLTKYQREKLREVQRVLLKDVSGDGDEDWCHIPHNMKVTSEASKNFLRQNFSRHGSEHVIRKGMLRARLKQAVIANTVVRKFEGLKGMAEASASGYLPEEWFKLKEETKERLREVLSWDNLCRWDFNVFELEELTGGQPLLFMGWAVLGSPDAQIAMAGGSAHQEKGGLAPTGYGFCDLFKIPQHVLCEFLRSIEGDYLKENPYHNAIHAADVTQTTHTLLQMGGISYGPDLEIFSILLAALVHDVRHPGYNNVFQIHDKTTMALIYNDKSVLENMHASHAFTKLMGEDAKPDHDVLAGMSDEQRDVVRHFVIEAVLHTDMTTHFASVDKMKGLLLTKSPDEIRASDRGAEALWYMLHLADISNPAKPDPMFELWTDRCLEEFFRQGDKEKELGLPVSPLCDRETTSRPESQIGFIQYVVKPAFEVLEMLLPKVGRKVLPVIDGNLMFWTIEEATLKETKKS